MTSWERRIIVISLAHGTFASIQIYIVIPNPNTMPVQPYKLTLLHSACAQYNIIYVP